MTTFIYFGITLCICVLLLVRDQRNRRHTSYELPEEWLKEWYQYEMGFRSLFRKLPSLRFMGVFRAQLLVFVAVPWILTLIASAVEGTMFMDGDAIGVIEDVLYFPVSITAVIIAYMFYGILNTAPAAFGSLRRVNDRSEHSINVIDTELHRSVSHILGISDQSIWKRFKIEYLTVFIAAVVLAFVLYHDNYVAPQSSYHSKDHFMGDMVNVVYWTLLLCYLTPLALGYLTRIILEMRSLGIRLDLSKVLQLEPLHPDNAGGVGKFGRLGWRIDLLLLPLIIVVVVWYFVNGITTHTVIVTALILPAIPFLFFFPLYGLHKAMKTAKQNQLNDLSMQFSRNAIIMRNWLNNKEGVTREEGLEAQEILGRVTMLHERASHMPVWPFDLTTLAAVGVYFLVPIGMMVLEHIW